tara:strand:- start:263 stop:523 length:261 start_codon:yes stop_codon:yes gene_type:complete
MTNKKIYKELNKIADQLNIKIIKGKGNFNGGVCVLKEELIIVLNKNKPIEESIRNLAIALLEFDISSISINPKMQTLLDDYQYIKD